MERYPVVSNGKILKWVVDSAEFTGINNKKYMWISTKSAKRIDKFIRGALLEVDGIKLNFARFYEDIPWPYVSVAWNLDEYVQWLKRQIPPNLKVVLNFSGGKDSVAAARVLVDAGADVTLVYSHVTYLENPKNIDFVQKASDKLGTKLIVVEADKKIMENMLKKGMPFRGNRWCTTQKVKPLKKILKEYKDYARADGERMFESIKRFKRLSFHSPSKPKVYDFKRVRPIFLLTLIDVVKIVRDVDLVHPDYVRGLPRVACTFCPYKALHELGEWVWKEVEDPGLIEEAIRASYKRLEYDIPFEEYWERHMWRFSPKLANTLFAIQRKIERFESLEEVESNTVNTYFASIWKEELPKPRKLRPEEAYALFYNVLSKVYARSVRLFEEGELASQT